MKRQDAIERLRAMEAELRAAGIGALFLFGSVARDEASDDSDVDLFCDLSADATIGLHFYALRDRIAETLGRSVDLTTRAGLHPLIRDRVTVAAVPVF